jgi:group I intron endonuclease
MGYIYMLQNNINGKIYIGQTIRSIEKRFRIHQYRCSRCVAIYNAIQKYGWENFEKDWYECPDEDLNFDEELLVREMGTLAPFGYNLKEGGANGKLSEETKQKIGQAHVGRYHTDETKKKISESTKGEKHHMYGKTGEKSHSYGKTLSEEHRQKMSDSTKGEKNHNSKRVYQYDLEGKLLGTFGSTGEAGLYIGKDGTNIRKCARGVQGCKTAYGFKWSY